MEVIGEAIDEYYDRAANCLGYCSEEGGYLGTTYDAYDLVYDEIPTPSDNEAVLEAIRESLDGDLWCDENPHGLSGLQSYNSSWEDFCETVKHGVRYFFDTQQSDDY